MKIFFCMFAAFSFVLFSTLSADSHEFIAKPIQMKISVNQALPFSVISCHVFMVSEEVEPIESVTATFVKDDFKQMISLKQNDILLTLDGTFTPEHTGTFILAAHREGIIWTKTTEGWKQKSKRDCTGVISSGKYEKFSKTLINVENSDEGYKQIIGHQLEIVPISSPTEIAPGKEMDFQILYKGDPLSTSVYATYDGFSDNPNTYAYFTETDENGVARVKITHPGTWMLRVEKNNDQATADYDKHVLRAVLLFEII